MFKAIKDTVRIEPKEVSVSLTAAEAAVLLALTEKAVSPSYTNPRRIHQKFKALFPDGDPYKISREIGTLMGIKAYSALLESEVLEILKKYM